MPLLLFLSQEQAQREKEELERMLEENRRKIEEAQRRAAEEQAKNEEKRYRELEALQRQKEEFQRRRKLEDEQGRAEQMKILGKKNTRPKLSFAFGSKWHCRLFFKIAKSFPFSSGQYPVMCFELWHCYQGKTNSLPR